MRRARAAPRPGRQPPMPPVLSRAASPSIAGRPDSTSLITCIQSSLTTFTLWPSVRLPFLDACYIVWSPPYFHRRMICRIRFRLAAPRICRLRSRPQLRKRRLVSTSWLSGSCARLPTTRRCGLPDCASVFAGRFRRLLVKSRKRRAPTVRSALWRLHCPRRTGVLRLLRKALKSWSGCSRISSFLPGTPPQPGPRRLHPPGAFFFRGSCGILRV